MNEFQLQAVALIQQYFLARHDRVGDGRQWKSVVDVSLAIREHVRGRMRLALSPFFLDGNHIKWAMIEAENHGTGAVPAPLSTARTIQTEIEKCLGSGTAWIEVSKGGNYHIWIFFSEPMPARDVRVLLRHVVREAKCPQTEIFPKQDRLEAEKIGNAVLLPFFGGEDILGSGILNGRTCFMDESNNPIIPRRFSTVDRSALYAAIENLPRLETADAVSPSPPTSAPSTLRPGLDIVRNQCEFFQYMERMGTNVSEALWEAWISNAVPFEGSRDYIQTFSAKYTPPPGKKSYSPEATDRKIQRSIAPYCCATIKTLGFKCNKRDCFVSSPASLAPDRVGTVPETNPPIMSLPSSHPPSLPSSPPAIPSPETADALHDLRHDFKAERSGRRQPLPLSHPRLNKAKPLHPGTVLLVAGPPNTAKSLFVANEVVHLHRRGVSVGYLPLEDRRADLQRRMLAIMARSWNVMNGDLAQANENLILMDRFGKELDSISQGIFENPHTQTVMINGRIQVQSLPSETVLNWVEEMLNIHQVVVVDPLSQIDFDEAPGRREYQDQASFIRRLTGIISRTEKNIILVGHTVKSPGGKASQQLSADDIEGSAKFGRLAQTIFMFNAHEPKDSQVFRSGSRMEIVQHSHTVYIAKSRNGMFPRARMALRLGDTAPVFEELGMIIPKNYKRRDANIEDMVTGKMT